MQICYAKLLVYFSLTFSPADILIRRTSVKNIVDSLDHYSKKLLLLSIMLLS